ncbi:MAG TPA: beta-L-arabinofuranosidase domain-containing protein [Sedimentisphaerales bacterium]|nr:beta-L-arabinofuranosidase domain-containing protein [Sedimentisphaerales bacterium]
MYAYDDIAENQMYITGGTSLNEVFQQPHCLPNTGHVSENCAQVSWSQLCIQLLHLTGEAKYADTLERIVYNQLLAAQKPSGEKLCYFSPLQGCKPFMSRTNCCTSSGPRGIALTTTYAYTLADDGVMVNFYEPSTLDARVKGVKLKLTQKTTYPLDGTVEIAVEPGEPVEFTLSVRIPQWCRSYTATVNGKPRPTEPGSGIYLQLSRKWKPGDTVKLDLKMPARLVKGTHTNEGFFAIRRGPLILALDTRLNPQMSHVRVSPAAEPDGTVKLTAVADPEQITPHAFKCEGLVCETVNNKVVLKSVPLVLTSFAEAGRTGSNYIVWLPSPDKAKTMPDSPFLFAMESWSRSGNKNGSFVDGDNSTLRVTFTRKKQDEDWFAVERQPPVTINSVFYAHGQCYHNGSWWDASKGEPRIQVKKTPEGEWQDVAAIDTYPDTTATDNKGLPNGKEFVVRFEPVKVIGIRIIGAPACGVNPKQNFASCAELLGVMENPEKR